MPGKPRMEKPAPKKLHVKKDDLVQVMIGKDVGKRGKVLRTFPETNRVIVEGIHMIKRHTRPNPRQNIKGGVVEREAAIHASNVMLVDPESGSPTRIRRSRLTDGRKVRVSVRSQGVIDK